MAKTKIRMAAHDDRVHLEINGTAHDFAWQDARQLAQGLMALSQRAEEHDKHKLIIADEAMLRRAGWRHGSLSGNRKITDAATVEASHNRTLRRRMPNRINPDFKSGLANIVQKSPK